VLRGGTAGKANAVTDALCLVRLIALGPVAIAGNDIFLRGISGRVGEILPRCGQGDDRTVADGQLDFVAVEDADVLLGIAALNEHLDVTSDIGRGVDELQLATRGVVFFREQDDELSRHFDSMPPG
jgi:hypothetical protein